MDTALILKVFGVYFVISGLFLALKGRTLPLIIKDLFQHPGVVYLAGIFLVFFGLFIVLGKDAQVGTSNVVVSVIGWLVLAKGVAYIFFPKMMESLPFDRMRAWFGILGAIVIGIGIYIFQLV
jgi:hypothetical protein